MFKDLHKNKRYEQTIKKGEAGDTANDVCVAQFFGYRRDANSSQMSWSVSFVNRS
jgi:hypothetical protein